MNRQSLFKIKICGITNLNDALAAEGLGAGALGLNFYTRSMRCISLETAQEICRKVQGGLVRVGVFVNENPHHIAELLQACPLDLAQLHGQEPFEIASDLPKSKWFKALRMGTEPARELAAQANRWLELGSIAILLDAPQRRGEFGGSGQPGNWELAAEIVKLIEGPVILAGGLSPDNVVQAIQITSPAAVDVASGVEGLPGKKDLAALREFIGLARTVIDR